MRWIVLFVSLWCAAMLPAVAAAYVPSPQVGAFELKFGPYTPNADDEPSLKESGATPYKDTFGDDWMFLTTVELDWQFARLPGVSFGLGGSLGFMQEYAKAETESGVESSDYTVLNVMPFSLLGVVRIDALADLLEVPIVPYFKGGLCWYLWWILGGGSLASARGEDAVGGTPGWQINPGIMLRLDQFDTMSARTFDNEIGVNHSYLFAELLWATVDGFGRDRFMYLSDTTFMAGIALEF